jgi:hypothetical protein
MAAEGDWESAGSGGCRKLMRRLVIKVSQGMESGGTRILFAGGWRIIPDMNLQ